MGTIYAGTAFQATDLQRNHREVLDAARESRAIIRDKDGVLLLVQPAEEAKHKDFILDVLSSAACLNRALQLPQDRRGPEMYGEFAFIFVIPEAYQKQFLQVVVDQTLIGRHSGSYEKLEGLIEDWKETARTWSDEDLREGLVGDLDHPLHDVLL